MFVTKIKKLADQSPRQFYQSLRKKFLNQGQSDTSFDKHPCVFVLSTGRVGTQTLTALLSLAPNVLVYHEPTPKLYGLSKLSYQFPDDSRISMILREAFLIARKEKLDYSLACGRGYIETSPQTTFLAPVILEAIPNVRFIHLVRMPQDVVRSGMRRGWYDRHYADKTRIVPSSGSEIKKKWPRFSSFQKNLWLWAETNRWILRFTATLPPSQKLLVHSEDIFSASEETLLKLFSFISVTTPAKQKFMSVLGKKLNAQKTGSFPCLSDWSETMQNDLLRITGETIIELGYDLQNVFPRKQV